MTDGYNLAEAQLLDGIRDVVGVSRDRVGAVRLVALAVPAQVERHHPMPPRKVLGLRSKERAVAGPAVYKDKGGFARAAILKGQVYTVAYDRRHAASPLFSSRSRSQPTRRPIRVISSSWLCWLKFRFG